MGSLTLCIATDYHRLWSTPSQRSIGVNRIFLTKGLALRENRCLSACPQPFKVFTFEEAVVFGGRSNFGNACFGITYRLRPTRKWSNIIIHSSGSIRAVLLSFIFLSFTPWNPWHYDNSSLWPAHHLWGWQLLACEQSWHKGALIWVYPFLSSGQLWEVLQWIGHTEESYNVSMV